MRVIRIGTRGSRLALVQTEAIVNAVRGRLEGVAVEVKIIKTLGDRVTDRPLSLIGDRGLFIKEIETALLSNEIDAAVHSMKDVPSSPAEGLVLAAATERADPRDVLVARTATSLETLPRGATVATGSLRRRSQLLALRPDVDVVELRGNVPTRLEKFDRSSWEAILLASAGLDRLGLAGRVRAHIPVETMIPAVGQGALAIETRADDAWLRESLGFLNHPETARAVSAERSFLARLEGGCQVPMGAHGQLKEGRLLLRAYVGSADGRRHLLRTVEGDPDDGFRLGRDLAEAMLAEGAADIVRDPGEPA